jgi:hypothetical protein
LDIRAGRIWSNFRQPADLEAATAALPLLALLSCTVNLLHPVTPGNLLVILPLFYAGAQGAVGEDDLHGHAGAVT